MKLFKKQKSGASEISSVKGIAWHATKLIYFGLAFYVVVSYFVLNSSFGEWMASLEIRDWILYTFPRAQNWVNATLVYKQTIVLMYPIYLLTFWLSALFALHGILKEVLNKEVLPLSEQMARQYTELKTWFKSVVAVALLLFVDLAALQIYIYGIGFEVPVNTVSEYSSRSVLYSIGNDVNVWNKWYAFAIHQFVYTFGAFSFALLLWRVVFVLPIALINLLKKR